MSTPLADDRTIEQERVRLAQEMADDAGPDWAQQYEPGTFGCHELLDRTALIADLVEKSLLEHPACIANPDWFILAERAAAALHELYQQVGSAHLDAEKPNE